MRKLLFLLIPLLIGASLFLGFRFIATSTPSISALQVTATPQAEVFVDNQSLGKTPLYNDKLKPGTHTIKLVPQAPNLSAFEDKITLKNGILTVVDRIFKQTEAESEMSIISLEEGSHKKTAEIAIVSTPDSAEVKLDEQSQGVTSLLLKDISISDHQITIIKEGYNSKILRVRPTEGYRLTIFAKLAVLRTIEPTPGPTPTEQESKSETIRILETPTGFLRVRERPSTSSTEIARVKPGETFALIEEQSGWYKIKLDEKEGWVSSQYATR